MKTTVLLIACTFLMAIGCASTKGTKDDYFGYTNSPKVEEDKPTPRSSTRKVNPDTDKPITTAAPTPDDSVADSTQDQDWVNPLADDQSDQDADYQDADDPNYAAVPAGYNSYAAPAYVPVIVPWWDYYSGWMGGYYVRPVIAVRYRNWYWGWNSYCDWYSPYYDYHPCYGVNFNYYRPFYRGGYRSYWRPWHHYPIYTYHPNNPSRPNTVRKWGTGTGVASPSTSGGGRNSTNPQSGTTAAPLRNERTKPSQNAATTTSGSTSSPSVRKERSTTDTPVRNDRAEQSSTSGTVSPSGTVTPGGTIKPAPRNGTQPRTEWSNTDVKPAPRAETPGRTERSNNEVKPAPRAESPAPRSETPARKETPNNEVKPAPKSETPVRKERPRSSIYSSQTNRPRIATSVRADGTSRTSRGYSSSVRGGSTPTTRSSSTFFGGNTYSTPRSSSVSRGSSFASPRSTSSAQSSVSSSSVRSGRRP